MADVARLGREQFRATTLLEGCSSGLDQLGETVREHIDQELREHAETSRALGALEDQLRVRLALDLLPVVDALQASIVAAHGFIQIAEDRKARGERSKGLLKSVHLDIELIRHDFEAMLRPFVQSTLESVDRALQDAGWRVRDLQKVLLVGGSTRIPLVRRMLAEHLGQEPQSDIHPDEAVALGAAVQAAIIAGEPIAPVLVDIAPRSLGIQAARLVLDHVVTDRYSVLIPRNTAVPCTKSEAYYTLAPDQADARIRVFQGDDMVASRNDLLGEFLFEDISPDPEGLNREVLVRFDYDVDGIVHVAAIDRRTDRHEGIKISASRQRLSASEKASSRMKLATLDRRLEREVDAVLRRSERLMVKLEADGQLSRAEEVLALAGDLERARKERDHDRLRALMERSAK